MDYLVDFILTHRLNVLAVSWFLFCFYGYMYYARSKSFNAPSLASTLHCHRIEWMSRLMRREVRMADNAAIANLERSVAFFASTTMLIIAGLITVLGSTEKAIDLVDSIPFSIIASRAEWDVKILVMIFVMVYAFFKFTWSLRQYGFVTIMMGAAPLPDEQKTTQERRAFSEKMASMASMAANNFNIGLRTYYFSIAILTWFISPWVFIASSSVIVFILFRREFKSSTLKILTMEGVTKTHKLRR